MLNQRLLVSVTFANTRLHATSQHNDVMLTLIAIIYAQIINF